MWKVRKFLTRKPDTKLKSSSVLLYAFKYFFVSHMDGSLSNFYSTRQKLFRHRTFINMFAKCGVKNRRGFPISVDTKNNRKMQLKSKIILHIDHHKQNIYMEKFSFIFLEKVDKLLFDA